MPARTAKRPTKKKSSRKQQLKCPECGLVLSVDEMCSCGDLCGVMCCGQPMRQKNK